MAARRTGERARGGRLLSAIFRADQAEFGKPAESAAASSSRGYCQTSRSGTKGVAMKRVISSWIVLVTGLCAAPASAGILGVSATISSVPDGPNFDYTILLKNSSTSTDSLEPFWVSWVPGKDFMPDSPISVTPPSGWTDNITHGGATDGFAIQYVTSKSPLAPGSSLAFAFTSPDTPAQLAGDSPFFPGIPAGTSFVYQGCALLGRFGNFRRKRGPRAVFAAAARFWRRGALANRATAATRRRDAALKKTLARTKPCVPAGLRACPARFLSDLSGASRALSAATRWHLAGLCNADPAAGARQGWARRQPLRFRRIVTSVPHRS